MVQSRTENGLTGWVSYTPGYSEMCDGISAGLTLYAEIVNMTNHSNYRYQTFTGYNSETGQAYPRLDNCS